MRYNVGMTTHRWITFTGTASDNLGLCDPDCPDDVPPRISFLECTLRPEWPCEACGVVEEGTGWCVLPDAIIGTGFGVVAVCTACLLEAAGEETLPEVQEGTIPEDGTVPA